MAEAIERSIATLARRQHGWVRRSQLLALGLGAEAIRHRTSTGRLIPVYAGIYAVGHVPSNPVDQAAGAILACGPKAALSHESAATLWGWRKPWRLPFHVIAPSGHERRGIIAHRSTALIRADFRTHLGVRVTSPARTALDTAPTLNDRQLRRMLSDARHSYLTLDALIDVVERFPRHPGACTLERYVETSPRASRSDWEDGFPVFCVHHGLPNPILNVRVHGYEVDAWFPDHKVAVELDGWDFHRDRDAFERDRERDAHLLQFGIETVRITWERIHTSPIREANRLHRILERRAGGRTA